MDKTKLQTLKGFRDFLPKEAKKRSFAIDIIKKTFELFGFEPLETPAMEYQEVLLGKYGDEADKLLYKFKDLGGRDVALRYDQTVPTARVLAMHHQELPTPWRRYQIQPVWRAEKPQSGRFREFLQADADIYGASSPIADAELIALSNQLFKNLGFKNFEIYVNDREILFELMKFASVPEEMYLQTISQIDKLDRMNRDEVSEKLKKVGLKKSSIKHLFHHLEEQKPTKNLKRVMDYAQNLGVEKNKLLFEARLARGLDYYTGTIFEIKIKEYKSGSVLGGGRYDNLIEKLAGVDIPAAGFALGFDRTIEAMDKLNLFPNEGKRKGALVAIFNKDLADESALVVESLRSNNLVCELYPEEGDDLKKQIKYADKKGLRFFIVIGPDEVEKNSVILKDLETGHQEDTPLKKLVDEIKKAKK